MNILITGASGFVGRNLVEAFRNIQTGKDRTRGLKIDKIYEFDLNTPYTVLEEACANADIVFHLAGINRPESNEEFQTGNIGFTNEVITLLKKSGNCCPIMLSSSIQAAQIGRFSGSLYGASKKAAEDAVFQYHNETDAPVYVFRFPNLFGKWCKPNYNSAVANFCYNIANDLPITISDPELKLDLLYIDDLVDGMIDLAAGKAIRCEYCGIAPVIRDDGKYSLIPKYYTESLGSIVQTIYSFREQSHTLIIPSIPSDSFAKKLYSTYLSYIPKEKTVFPLKMNKDARGSFTELFKSDTAGQVSVNISEPGIAKGRHWHNSKWEFFVVVSGHALIRERDIRNNDILEFEVYGEEMKAVHMIPGYTHEIINLSETEKLITVMWANESFDPDHPDTFFEEV